MTAPGCAGGGGLLTRAPPSMNVPSCVQTRLPRAMGCAGPRPTVRRRPEPGVVDAPQGCNGFPFPVASSQQLLNEENLRKQEASVQKQEAMRRGRGLGGRGGRGLREASGRASRWAGATLCAALPWTRGGALRSGVRCPVLGTPRFCVSYSWEMGCLSLSGSELQDPGSGGSQPRGGPSKRRAGSPGSRA